MGAAYFYHLTHSPLETTLPMLLEKSLAAGWRVAVRGTDPDRMNWLDEKLWSGPPEGFLAHGKAGGPHDQMQPILLSADKNAANNPDCIMSVDGADVAPDEVSTHARVCIIFDGNDPQSLDRAREQWRVLTKAGCTAQYWSQESGSWSKKAESSAD